MTIPTTYVSFLIRMWRERDPDQSERLGDWQGEVEHIQSGQLWTFRTIQDLFSLLHDQVEAPLESDRPRPAEPQDADSA